MDSFELNKLIGGLLGTVFVVFSVGLVSDALFASPAPEKPGYPIEAAEPDEGAAAGPATEVKPIAERLASAKPEAGEAIFKKCQACHDGTKGGPKKVGPNLWGVVDRVVASHEGFAYSAGMKARLAFGICMAIDFEYYLIDEVIAVGDSNFKKKSKRVFDERRENATLLLVSHSSGLLRSFCHVGGVIKDGRITFYDSIDEAIDVHEANLAQGK